MEQSGYGDFIREAFIDPIRTVIVVDDEFPTLEALIDKETSQTKKLSWESDNISRVQEIIHFCRGDERKWMVEINDGKFKPGSDMDKTIGHLHQSDLLILDYHLDAANPNDGTRAIEILRHLARNDHFNLVVVYTKGYEHSSGDIERVVREIAVGLSHAHAEMHMPQRALQAANNIVEEREDENPGFTEQLKQSVDEATYLAVAKSWKDKDIPPGVFDLPELQAFNKLMNGAPTTLNAQQKRQLLKWALHHQQSALCTRFSSESFDGLDYRWDSNGGNWIRTDRLFVTVVNKTNKPKELPSKLIAALKIWNPEPHRLLMSRMRAELDEIGVLAETNALGNRHLQAGWLEEFLTEEESARTWKIRNTVTRHWESLGGHIHEKASEFSERLAEHLIADKPRVFDIFNLPKPDEQRSDIALHMNRYVCSKPVEGHHLTTGHVLSITQGKQKSYWLCLSPACDLVPGQKTTGWAGRLKEYIAFTAVELFVESKPESALEHAYGGNYLFLAIDGDTKCFSFTPPPGNGAETKTPNPKWEQMFADNQGHFDDSKKITIRRVAADTNENLAVSSAEAQVVAQLRYEYALNLLQRLGANLSRVGLDFIQHA